MLILSLMKVAIAEGNDLIVLKCLEVGDRRASSMLV